MTRTEDGVGDDPGGEEDAAFTDLEVNGKQYPNDLLVLAGVGVLVAGLLERAPVHLRACVGGPPPPPHGWDHGVHGCDVIGHSIGLQAPISIHARELGRV